MLESNLKGLFWPLKRHSNRAGKEMANGAHRLLCSRRYLAPTSKLLFSYAVLLALGGDWLSFGSPTVSDP